MFLLGAMQILWWPLLTEVTLMIATGLLFLCSLLKARFNHLIPVIFFISGVLYAMLACQIQLQSEIETPQKRSFQGRIESLPKHTAQKVSFISSHSESKQSFLLNWYSKGQSKQVDFEPGNLYQFEVSLKPPHGMANGIGFDREKWLFRNRIDGIGTIKSMDLIAEKTRPLSSNILNQWRATTGKSIDQHFKEQRINGLIHALSIGDKSHFEHQDFQLFQNTGTAHLIAISGLHIGMVALLGWLLGGLVFQLLPQQIIPKSLIQIYLGLLFAVLYAALAGFAVSTQRALIMLLVYALFKIFRRASYAWDVWSTSLLAVLLLDPLNVLDAGFWLSFTAVAVLILSFNGISNTHSRTSNFIVMQWRLLLGMLPLSLLVFSRVNLLAPLINLLMIPLMTFLLVPMIMLLLIIGTLFNFMPETLIDLLSWSSQLFLDLLTWFAHHASWPIHVAVNSWWQLALLGMGTTLFILPKAIPQRFWGLPLILMAIIPIEDRIKLGQFNAYFLDVGQGLSVVIKTQSHQLIYDVGSAYESGFNMADAITLPWLQQQNITDLDALVLSHQDNDHSGAEDSLLDNTSVETIWGTEKHHLPCIAGTQWQWDNVTFSFLSPYNLTPYLKNNSSCVLKISGTDFSLLLTGDIETPVEYRLSQAAPELIQADVLLVPHHGSKTSSSAEFIQAVNPQLAINSSGKYNPFNHPAKQVVDQYTQLGIPLIDTQDSGMITLNTYPTLQYKRFRNESVRIWRKKKPE
ncbi:competence protein ComEC [Marinicella litoralis]|uniref:Competence protein ComEC n=2 Tax=Marinicella litoralis TaxID=644220 RepID=A0A4R6XNL0_9GAMM|nr:competence protein ComEC [Marinicella litoralis]